MFKVFLHIGSLNLENNEQFEHHRINGHNLEIF